MPAGFRDVLLRRLDDACVLPADALPAFDEAAGFDLAAGFACCVAADFAFVWADDSVFAFDPPLTRDADACFDSDTDPAAVRFRVPAPDFAADLAPADVFPPEDDARFFSDDADACFCPAGFAAPAESFFALAPRFGVGVCGSGISKKSS